MSPDPQAPRPTSAARSDRGCFIALAVVGGGAFVTFVVVAVLAVRFLRTDQGKAATQIMGEGMKIATQAQSAPGASAIRKAGCAQGVVMRLDDFERIARLTNPDAQAADRSQRVADVIVTCSAPFLGAAPTCEAVKAAYFGAVQDPGGRVLVQVVTAGGRHPTCSAVYDEEGTFLRTVEIK